MEISKDNKLNYKLIKIILIIAAIFCAAFIYSCKLYINNRESDFQNRARVILNDSIKYIRNGDYDDKNIKYHYVLFDLSGKVIYSSVEDNFKKGEIYNLNEELEFDKSYYNSKTKELKYSFIIKDENDKADSFALFLVPRKDIEGANINVMAIKVLSPFIVFIFILLSVFIYESYYLKKHILGPIGEINKSSKAIINGDYNVQVVKAKKLKDDEVEELSYNFELMRDELKNKEEKELALKNSQKELISCMSHDLKTPISTIKAYSEGLLDNICNSEEKRVKYEKIILSKSEVLVKMINDLLEHSNAELNELKSIRDK